MTGGREGRRDEEKGEGRRVHVTHSFCLLRSSYHVEKRAFHMKSLKNTQHCIIKYPKDSGADNGF